MSFDDLSDGEAVVLALRVICFMVGVIFLFAGFANFGNATFARPVEGLVQSTTGVLEIGMGGTLMLFAAGGADLVGTVLGFIASVFRVFVDAIAGVLKYFSE